MNTVADDLQEPDETRPAKRVRLEAPLDMTEEVEEEMIDDEDLYGTPAAGEPDARAVVEEPHLQPTAGEDAAHELPNNIKMVDTGSQAHVNGSATPKIDGEEGVDSEDLYGENAAEAPGDLPAGAVDDGQPDFVAPPKHAAEEDGVEEIVMAETSRVEAEPSVEDVPSTNGEHKASTDVTKQQNEAKLPQHAPRDSIAESNDQHIAPERTRIADGQQTSENVDKMDEEDFYGDLESALNANKISDTVDHGVGAQGPNPKDDPEFREAAAAQKGKEEAEWQFDSSDAESSSDSSDSSSSDSDSDSDSEGGYEMLDPGTAAKMLMAGDGEDDDGKEKGTGGSAPRTVNEAQDEIVPKPDVNVTQDMKITLLGTVENTVESKVVIQGTTTAEYRVLESGSALCNASREVLGAVADTFGLVTAPFYTVAFTNLKEIEDAGLKYGSEVFYVDEHSKFTFTQPLRAVKGTDASNIHDEEVGEDEAEFSDDEKEAEYKRQKKAAKRGGRGALARGSSAPSRGAHLAERGRTYTIGAPGHDGGLTTIGNSGIDAPVTTYGGGMSYDDDEEDEFYQPLKRPDNLSQLMAGGPPPPPPSQRGGFDRGRGRGRGRGDRGRGDRGRGRGGVNQRGHHQGGGMGDGARGGGHGQNGQRGGRDQALGDRKPAHSFPDHHNNNKNNRSPKVQNFAGSRTGQQSPPSQQSSPQNQPRGHYPPHQSSAPAYQQQVPASSSPQSYQFNGYTFQYGNSQPPPQSSAQYQQPPPQQQYWQYQQQYPQQPQQQSPGAQQFPAGAYVNPAFWAGQQQQQAPQQYGGWGAQQQQQQYPQYQAQNQGQGRGQPDLAEVLRQLGPQQGQQQGQGRW